MNGVIFDIKEMAVHDGPGVRTTVFFKGCPLRCRWCHNPEGLTSKPQLMYKGSRCLHCGLCKIPCTHPECQPFGRCLHACPDNLLYVAGRTVSAEELAAELKKSAEPLGDNFGGFTFSGGEPIMQPEFLLFLAEELKGFITFVKESLGDQVKEVRLSQNLGSYPVAMVPEAGMSFEMEKYMKRVNPEFAYPVGRVLELNPEHEAVKTLQRVMTEDPVLAKDYAQLLCCQAQLMAQLPLDDPFAYSELVCKLMK